MAVTPARLLIVSSLLAACTRGAGDTASAGSTGTTGATASTVPASGASDATAATESSSTQTSGPTTSAGTTAGTSSSSTGSTGTTTDTGGGTAERIHGVTIDAIDPLPEILDALGSLHKRPTTRVVFDEFVPAADYVDAVTAISDVSFVMGELLDSFYVSLYSPAEYDARVTEYLDAMAGVVDIWEVGNEINGEWVCDQNAASCAPDQTAEVVAKMQGAFDQVKARGELAALTLYYNEDCWSAPENEMFAWAAANVPQVMRGGLDYVLVSYYEDDCNGLQPDWPAVFAQLRALFPTARLGIGECGTTVDDQKVEFIQRYYAMAIDDPGYVGGYFWWYFLQDMVPKTQPLWQTLDDALGP